MPAEGCGSTGLAQSSSSSRACSPPTARRRAVGRSSRTQVRSRKAEENLILHSLLIASPMSRYSPD